MQINKLKTRQPEYDEKITESDKKIAWLEKELEFMKKQIKKYEAALNDK